MTDTTNLPATPRHLSPIPEGTDIEAAHVGARLQRLPMTPQGEIIAGVLEARNAGGFPLYDEVSTEVPRRATKTTSIQNVLLGRCATRPGYQVCSTAQDGTRASQFMRDMMDLIVNHANEIVADRTEELLEKWENADKEPPEFTLKMALLELGIRTMYYSQQREFIKWTNGSKWRVSKPEASGLRGGAADVFWFDEAGELDPETSPALLAGALPLLDTRPHGQCIYSGTPGEVRAGGFWDALETARKAPNKFGIVEYCAEEFDDVADEAVWWRVHPGLACGLTRIETLRKRFKKLGPAKFAMEYLCIWPADLTTSAIDPRAWAAASCEPLPFAGQDFDLTFDCHIQGYYASLVATWLDDEGNPHGQLMDYRPGTEWLAAELVRAQRAHPRVDVYYDAIGSNAAVAVGLQRVPTFKAHALKVATMKDAAAGAALLASHLDARTITISQSASMDNAAESVTWRWSGESRLFGRKNASVDVSGVVGLSIGLSKTLSRRAKRTKKRAPAVFG
jgi:hypothetical protein